MNEKLTCGSCGREKEKNEPFIGVAVRSSEYTSRTTFVCGECIADQARHAWRPACKKCGWPQLERSVFYHLNGESVCEKCYSANAGLPAPMGAGAIAFTNCPHCGKAVKMDGFFVQKIPEAGGFKAQCPHCENWITDQYFVKKAIEYGSPCRTDDEKTAVAPQKTRTLIVFRVTPPNLSDTDNPKDCSMVEKITSIMKMYKTAHSELEDLLHDIEGDLLHECGSPIAGFVYPANDHPPLDSGGLKVLVETEPNTFSVPVNNGMAESEMKTDGYWDFIAILPERENNE